MSAWQERQEAAEERADYIFEMERDERMFTTRDELIARLARALAHLSHENQIRVICAHLGIDELERAANLHEASRRGTGVR